MTKKQPPARWLLIAAVVGVLVATVGSPAGGQARMLPSVAPASSTAALPQRPVAPAEYRVLPVTGPRSVFAAAPTTPASASALPFLPQDPARFKQEKALAEGAGPASASPGGRTPQIAGAAPRVPLLVEDGGLRKIGRLSPPLDELYRLDLLGRAANRPIDDVATLPRGLNSMKRLGKLRLDRAGSVEVYVRTLGQPDSVVPQLTAFGLRDQRIDQRSHTVQGNLPIAALRAASLIPGVLSVRPPDYPAFDAGSVTTQGDSILHADELRAKLGVDGTGVTVGVISDGLYGLATSQSTGDLPPSVNSTTCDVVGADPTAQAAGAEGTAMLEIVHDLAPGAKLWFGYFGAGTQTGGTSLDFMAAVNCLAAHVDIVVDDVSFFNDGPYDGTSPVSANAAAALNAPQNPIRGYYTAVGNYAGNHYEEPYGSSGSSVVSSTNPSDFWTLHGFQATASTLNAGHTVACPTPSAYSCGDQLMLTPGAIMAVSLEWTDPFGNSTNDYDLMLLDETTGKLYLASTNRQAGTGSDPTESFVFQNPYPAALSNFDIVIGNYRNAAAPRTFNMFIQCYGCQALISGTPTVYHNFNTAAGSVPNNADANGGVGSLGAEEMVNYTIEPFSSQGPTADGRTKPDATAVDGVSVSGAGGFPTTFTGTSAAAPHAAGIAALLLSCNPSLRKGVSGTPPGLARGALHTAVFGTGAILQTQYDPPNAYGIGLINAWEATGPAQCQSEMTSMVIPQLRDVATAGSGHIYVVDGCAIREFILGIQARVVGPNNCAFIDPSHIAADSAGNVYVSDDTQCAVYRIALSGAVTTIAGPSLGQTQRCYFAGDGGPATQASIGYPGSIALDGKGNVYVVDSLGCRIREIHGGVINTFAGNGSCANSGDGGAAVHSSIHPSAVRLDALSDVYIASNCVVREVVAGIISTVAGNNHCSGSSGDGGPATQASLFAAGIALDDVGDLFIADSLNCNVREVNKNGVISTVAGIGLLQPGLSCAYNGFNGYTGAARGTAIAADDVAVDAVGSLYISDYKPFDTTLAGIVRVASPTDSVLDGYPDLVKARLGKSITVYCAVMRADVDYDGQVSILDLAAVAGHFLQTVPPAPARYDQDGDGVISILDLAQMAGVFLQPVTACP